MSLTNKHVQQLMSAVDGVRRQLERYISDAAAPGDEKAAQETKADDRASVAAAEANFIQEGRLTDLAERFHLEPFEQQVLLLCIGGEMEASFAHLFAEAHQETSWTYPTLGLAIAALDKPDWPALTPAAPLRRWRLIEIGPGPGLMTSPIRVAERVLHFLLDADYIDEQLSGLLRPAAPELSLSDSQTKIVGRIERTWKLKRGTQHVVQLIGADAVSRVAVARAACSKLNYGYLILDAASLPSNRADLERMIRLCEREAILSNSMPLLDCSALDSDDRPGISAVRSFCEQLVTPLLITSQDQIDTGQRNHILFDISLPTVDEQMDLWLDQFDDSVIGDEQRHEITEIVHQFSMNQIDIETAYLTAFTSSQGVAQDQKEDGEDPNRHNKLKIESGALWAACQTQVRPRMDGLAQPLVSQVGWVDLVLPERHLAILEEVGEQVRQRYTVYESWGFAEKGRRGLGISALFAGASGTGKTLAAEVLANTLRLDLYRIDLSAVVSKYIGETEKNLARIFDAADGGGVILLFDEADALFGKRGEVRDSHDRYANIEVSYLLQRMESFQGLSILTTNMEDALDPAFLRRIRFVIDFPFPDAEQRMRIWQRSIPDQAPSPSLDWERLAQLNVTGGHIRNMVMHAAFLAADEGPKTPIAMKHMLHAAHREYAKLDKPLTRAELQGWI